MTSISRLPESFSTVSVTTSPGRLVMMAEPDGVERVLRSGRDNYVKGTVYDGTRLLLGQGLVTSEEALLLVEPDHLDQLLHDQIDRDAEVTVRECVNRTSDHWSFVRNGLDGTRIGLAGVEEYAAYHSGDDVPAVVGDRRLAQAARAVWAMVSHEW